MSSSWKKALQNSIIKPEQIPGMDISTALLSRVTECYPMRINPYFLRLVKEKRNAIYSQVIPHPEELSDKVGLVDPLAEERDSPVPLITHRYPDRVLFLVSHECAVYCRFCTRKRLTGKMDSIPDSAIVNAVEYIRNTSSIHDVLVSGGDPLVLPDKRIKWILKQIYDIDHVQTVRIGTRVPGALPERITPALIRILKRFHPLYMNIHFNHPDEITEEVKKACKRLSGAGIVLSSQTVLLKGINDSADILEALFRALLKIKVKPYYLLQADLTKGTNHFRTRIETGLEIMKKLQGNLSGMAIPKYVIDLPHGGGKVPLCPDYIKSINSEQAVVINYQGKEIVYPQAI